MCSNASRCRVGGYPASAPAMSNPHTPRSRQRTARSAISRLRAAVRIAVSSVRTVIGRPSLPSRNPSCTASTTSSSARPPLEMQLGREPHLGVHDAVVRQVLRAFAGDADQRLGRLHHADRVRERLEVQDQVLAAGAPRHPRAELRGVGGRKIRVPGLVGELDDRVRSEAAVEMVVEQDLRRSADLVDGGRVGHARQPTSAATRSTTSRQKAPIRAGSSMNCDGLMQIDVNPAAT